MERGSGKKVRAGGLEMDRDKGKGALAGEVQEMEV
jgi:hypothetical protein